MRGKIGAFTGGVAATVLVAGGVIVAGTMANGETEPEPEQTVVPASEPVTVDNGTWSVEPAEADAEPAPVEPTEEPAVTDPAETDTAPEPDYTEPAEPVTEPETPVVEEPAPPVVEEPVYTDVTPDTSVADVPNGQGNSDPGSLPGSNLPSDG